jgi:predicted nucleic acid-binding protein
MILLDTNLLIRMTRSVDPQSHVARAAVQRSFALWHSLENKLCAHHG